MSKKKLFNGQKDFVLNLQQMKPEELAQLAKLLEINPKFAGMVAKSCGIDINYENLLETVKNLLCEERVEIGESQIEPSDAIG